MARDNLITLRTGSGSPSAAAFAVGEPAWDSTSGKLYVKNAAGTMVEVGSDVYEAETPASFPATGRAGVVYIATNTARVYRWYGVYVEIGTAGFITEAVDGGGFGE